MWLFLNKSIKIQGFVCYRDGLKIHGTVFRPEASEGTRLPIAIVCHEFMANRLFSFPYAYNLVKNGYAAFCFDFNGGGIVSQSEGSSRNMSVLTEMDDLLAVVDHANRQPYTDGCGVVLYGCSQGGLVCALTAARFPDSVKALILQYPALSIPDDARKGKMIKAEFDPNAVPELLRCGPMKLGRRYAADVMDMDVSQATAGYAGRVLIMHGDKDTLVDISYSEAAFERYRQAGAQVQFAIIEGAGHIFVKPKHIKQANRCVTDFLSK